MDWQEQDGRDGLAGAGGQEQDGRDGLAGKRWLGRDGQGNVGFRALGF